METLVDLFKSFKGRGDKTAIIYRTGVRRFVFSYFEIFQMSLKFASWLKSQEIVKGDKVIIWALNSPWWVVAYFGSIISGVVIVPIDFASGKDRAQKILELTKSKLIIQSQYKFDRFQDQKAINIEDLEYLVAGLEPSSIDSNDIQSSILVELIYTSGTTGDPKGVMLSHKNLITNLKQVTAHISIDSSYNFLSLLPLSHMFEQTCGFLSPLYLGGSVIYLRTLKPSAIFEAFKKEDVYVAVCVPRLLQLLKTSIEREFQNKNITWLLHPLSFLIHNKFGKNFKFFVSGGAALNIQTGKFWQKIGFKVLEGYGLTETAPVLTANVLDKQILGTVGKCLPGVQIKLEENEILAKGENIFKGYYENDEATNKVFTKDGWFKTGDLGEFGADGYLKIKGRLKDMIVTGAGINVFPDDVEDVLNNIIGVKESCVLGVDHGNGNEVHAALILEQEKYKSEEVIQLANNQLDPEQRITSYSVWPYPEFPKTTTLKIQKFLIKKEIEEKQSSHSEEILRDKLINLIAMVTHKPLLSIAEDSVIVRDLDLTSITRLELVNFIELEYKMDLDDNMIDQNTTVSTLRKTIINREKYKVNNHLRFWPNSAWARALRFISDTLITYPLFKHYVKLEVVGDGIFNNLSSPVIFISNHISFGDHPSIYFALKRRWRSKTATAAFEEFFFPENGSKGKKLLRRIFFDTGSLFLNLFPLSQVKGFRETLNFMGKLADNKINILIFPEGTRSKTGELLPFMSGIGIIVKELKIPVIPIKISGIDEVLHRDMRWPKRGWAQVKFGKPIFFTKESPSEIAGKCREAILKL